MQSEIKSYVCREGRMTQRQQQGIIDYLGLYQLRVDDVPWRFHDIFQRDADTVIEIGFGMGHSLIKMAQEYPELNFIGIEVHRPGVGQLLADIHEYDIRNIRVVPHDAIGVFLSRCLPVDALAGVQIFFPDPWPKRRHHKRRLIRPSFIKLILDKIRVGGFIHCATDWEDYASHMDEVLSAEQRLRLSGQNDSVPIRPETKFEARGKRLGHGVWDLVYYKVS